MFDYSGDELRDDVRATFEHHLSRCANCREYLALYMRTMDLSRQIGDVDQADAVICGVPEDLVTAILAARRLIACGE